MAKVKMVCFDMDGTVADLYGVPGWVEMLRAYDPAPYLLSKPMLDMARLVELLIKCQEAGIEVRLITWLS